MLPIYDIPAQMFNLNLMFLLAGIGVAGIPIGLMIIWQHKKSYGAFFHKHMVTEICILVSLQYNNLNTMFYI